jgi:hypothetical protein
LTSTFCAATVCLVDSQIDLRPAALGESEFTVEEAVVAQEAFAAPTAEASQPATASADTERRERLMVATLLVVELAWLCVVGFSLYWLLA